MKISSLQEYGIRCLVQLAMGDGKPQTTTSIAQKEGLSRDYVEKILFQLSKANLVKSVRGINGGYVLAKDADHLSLGQAIMVLSERPIRMNKMKDDLCKQFPGKKSRCVHMGGCTIRMLWSLIITQLYGTLNNIPLSTLVGTEEEVQHKLLAATRGNLQKVEASAS